MLFIAHGTDERGVRGQRNAATLWTCAIGPRKRNGGTYPNNMSGFSERMLFIAHSTDERGERGQKNVATICTCLISPRKEVGRTQLACWDFLDACYLLRKRWVERGARMTVNESDSDLMKIEQIARVLNVPVSWVYERTRRRGKERIPHIKLGKYLRFENEAVRGWLKGLRSA
jgi:excisionase family DNA binding protein